MGAFLLGLVLGGNLVWVFMSITRDRHWGEYNARRRGSNPPSPGRKPAPPAWPPEQPIRFDEGPTQRGNIQRGRNP